jgi:hypothetical protein
VIYIIRYKKLKEPEYEKIKELITVIGLSGKQVKLLTKRSSATISYIKNTQNYKEYVDRVSKIDHSGNSYQSKHDKIKIEIRAIIHDLSALLEQL